MSSIKIKSKNFKSDNGECVAQIVILPENNRFRIYVAWENESSAKDGFMGFYKARDLVNSVTMKDIEYTKKYGYDIGHLPECKRIFKAIL